MEPRLNYMTAAPDAFKAVLALEEFVTQKSGLDHRLLHLLKLRASHINSCAFCIDMHVKEARRAGLSEQWIALVPVWRDTPIYDARERALLAWTEALTNVAQTGAPAADFDGLKPHFSQDEIAKLTVAIGMINVWNRIAVGFRTQHPVDPVN
ncbi:carboxymuconolactone decarboxylase family protein [Actibacterium sp. 188UL27-1]|uniref:carboxymuconolactone decarboxylase family protein n=1 Tax=Actibacterium sp. 188UL27-1 TaxID=2786961 RepID=UPI001959E642|nr:carboxymuconolactone decarboxylase family protein [Actibacterium sp. 188UL27-1]MBM7065969.1 carboxymuconolactone decarboxylase family protein [Actibacterium sp. 188UL27-1]